MRPGSTREKKAIRATADRQALPEPQEPRALRDLQDLQAVTPA